MSELIKSGLVVSDKIVKMMVYQKKKPLIKLLKCGQTQVYLKV